MNGVVLLTTRNEAACLGPVLAEIDEAASMLGRAGIRLRVLMVDAESRDASVAVATEAAATLGLPLVVHEGEHPGMGAAALHGLRIAIAEPDVDFIVTMDADGQHDARQIPDLVRAHLSRRSGITIGSRWTRGGRSPGTGALRSLMSLTGNLLARRVAGIRGVADATTAFRVIDPKALRVFLDEGYEVAGYGFHPALVAIVQAHGFPVDEVPICFRPRYSGVSTVSLQEQRDFLRVLMPLREVNRRIRAAHKADQTSWAQRRPDFRGQDVSAAADYGAHDELHSLAHARRFHRWLVDLLRPMLSGAVLEVGAGIGTVTKELSTIPGLQVTSLEPDPVLYDELRERTAGLPRVTISNASTLDLRDQQFDAVIYVNVMEHIEDHLAELRRGRELLRPGGMLGIIVPAMPSLYGSLDLKSGHFRRYRKASLVQLLEAAGFEVVTIRHFDTAGVLPYWLSIRLGAMRALSPASAKLFDTVLVPASMLADRVAPNLPFGKNLLVHARRTG